MSKLAYYEQYAVRLEGKIVGTIHAVYSIGLGGVLGYQYKPKGGTPGIMYPTLAACKQSLN